MRLPGGLWSDGKLRRDCCFRPVTGVVELAIAESATSGRSIPARVTTVLASALEHLGGQEPTPRLIGRLCVADRQYLARQLAIEMGLAEIWLTATCDSCQGAFDVPIVHSQLPVKPAGVGFPFATADTSYGRCRLRVPNGDDQEAIANLEDGISAARVLVRRCIVPAARGGGTDWYGNVDVDALTDSDWAAVDGALESVSPELAVCARVECPACQAVNDVDIDPYICLRAGTTAIYVDVHALASVYHWGEAEILDLPRDRRKLYLTLVDRSRGTVS